ncbi:MAG: hypothetical protein ACRD1R_02325 [Acidobacteriota bacterium]
MANLSQRWRVWLSVVAIFLLGTLAGSLATTLHFRWRAPRPQIAQFPERGLQRLFNRLDLSNDQEAEVRIILDHLREDLRDLRRDMSPRIQDIRAKADRGLREVLSDDQWQEFQRLTPRRGQTPSMRGRPGQSSQGP